MRIEIDYTSIRHDYFLKINLGGSMKKTSLVIGALLAGATGSAAKEVGKLAFDFIAPSVPSVSAAPNETGLIVFDSGTQQFKGRSSNGTWQPLTNDASVVNVPVGTILPFAGGTAPFGYLPCDGVEKSRTAYPALFAALATTWGEGDGTTTFNLPDLRGRFLRGQSGTALTDPDAASRFAIHNGGAMGDNVGSYQLDEIRSHSHAAPMRGNGPAAPFAGFGIGDTAGYPTQYTYAAGGSESRPVNAAVLWIIKAE